MTCQEAKRLLYVGRVSWMSANIDVTPVVSVGAEGPLWEFLTT